MSKYARRNVRRRRKSKRLQKQEYLLIIMFVELYDRVFKQRNMRLRSASW